MSVKLSYCIVSALEKACFRKKTSLFQCLFVEMNYHKHSTVLMPSFALRVAAAAAPALRERAVRTAVVVISGLVPHEALKRLVIAIGEIHRIPPFEIGLGLAVYIENVSARQK